MEGRPSLKIKHLLATWATFPADMRNDTQISIAIIKHFLGEEWAFKHILPDTKKPGILTVRGTISEKQLAKFRIVDLAESLLNLRHIRGINVCIDQMRTAKNLEPSLAELHVGKMLYANDWHFNFVVPQGDRGENYDLQIRYFNQTVCADVKCKIESDAPPKSSAIKSTLKRSRTQLPEDKPGVFFVKFPQRWMEYKDWDKTIIQGAIDFFNQGSGRIASVVFYAEPIYLRGQVAQQGHTFCEIANHRRRDGQNLDWKFFEKWRPKLVHPFLGSWNAMPPKYIRLFEFPKGLTGHEKE